MDKVYDRETVFATYTMGIKRVFKIISVNQVSSGNREKRKKAKYEYRVENMSVDIHPGMTEKTKERLRYFTISAELLNRYVAQNKWRLQ